MADNFLITQSFNSAIAGMAGSLDLIPATYLLYLELGISALAGLGFGSIFLIAAVLFSRKFGKMR